MKSRIPPYLIAFLSPASNPKLVHVKPVDTQDILVLQPKDENFKELYFKILKSTGTVSSRGQTVFNLEVRPSNLFNGDVGYYSKDAEGTAEKLNEWLDIIVDKYIFSETIFDDPILKSYQKDYEEKYKILDDDAEFAPFNLERQLAITESLDKINRKLEEFRSPNNDEEIKEIQQDCKDLKETITTQTKNQTIKKLARIFAKIQKAGLHIVKEVLTDVTAKVLANLITGS